MQFKHNKLFRILNHPIRIFPILVRTGEALTTSLDKVNQ
jgi:hypothetical protein